MWYLISGVVFGIIGGMGLGGGVILLPVLTLLLGMDQHMAQGSTLIVFVPMSIAALILHMKAHRVEYKRAMYVIIPGVVTAVASAFCAGFIEGEVLRKGFGVFLLIIGISRSYAIVRAWRDKRKLCAQNNTDTKR